MPRAEKDLLTFKLPLQLMKHHAFVIAEVEQEGATDGITTTTPAGLYTFPNREDRDKFVVAMNRTTAGEGEICFPVGKIVPAAFCRSYRDCSSEH